MSTNRMLLRTALPPVLALGLVALVVHPMQALAVASQAAQPTGPAASAVSPVAFEQTATLSGGRLRTTVLADRAGTASVVGVTGCTTAVAPGRPAHLDCAYTGRAATVSVVVTLADGRAFGDTGVIVHRG